MDSQFGGSKFEFMDLVISQVYLVFHAVVFNIINTQRIALEKFIFIFILLGV